MNRITIKKNDCLVLKNERFFKLRKLKRIRKNIIRQMEEGVVIIPNGFSYSIIKREFS